MFNKLSSFYKLPLFEKQLFFEAVGLALWSRFYISFFPFRKLAPQLGISHSVTSNEILYDNSLVKKIIQAMNRSSRYLPFRKKCLVEAIVVKKMLEKRSIKSTLYLGVSKKDKNEMIAHAWLLLDKNVIVGKQGMEKFVPVEWYS